MHEKTMAFAVRVVKMCQYLQRDRGEMVMSRQVLRSGTAIGAIVREAQHGESKADFIHKLSMALKEANETDYWIDLLLRTEYIDMAMYASMNDDCQEIISILIKIIKTTKASLK